VPLTLHAPKPLPHVVQRTTLLALCRSSAVLGLRWAKLFKAALIHPGALVGGGAQI
jgi:hypothetical protein